MIDLEEQRQLYFDQIPNPDPRSVAERIPLKATPAPTGTGPDGERCGTCKHRTRVRIRSGRVFQKCAMVKARWTHGAGTDVKLRWPACSFWEPEDG